jgi:hypothetical protein
MRQISHANMIQHLVAIFLWFLLLGSPLGAFATPVTYDYTSTHTSGGVVTGSFTYETTSSPLALNVRGLSPNATYAMTQWNFSVISGIDFVQNTTFTNTQGGNSLEFCVGSCIFAGGSRISLTFLNPDASMRISFLSLDPTPLASPPANISEWGDFGQGEYRASGHILVYRTGTLTQSVPVPSTILPMTLGMAGLLCWHAAVARRRKPLDRARLLGELWRVSGSGGHCDTSDR